MPVDKHIMERYKLLDKLFRREAGYTYNELADEVSNLLNADNVEKEEISVRTIKADKKYFEEEYGAIFRDGLKRGREKVIRYEDTETSVFAARLSEEEKGVIGKLVDMLQLHEDIPQYRWAIFLLDGLTRIDEGDDLGNYIEFENNLYLEGLENFRILMEACMEKFVISLKYATFKQAEEPKIYTVSPYLLKQYNNRWFLICKRTGSSHLSTFPLDRIKVDSIYKETEMKYEEPDWIAIGKELGHTIGLTFAFDPEKRADVIIDVNKDRYPYIKTKPIISDQDIVCEDEEKVRLSLKDITINKELKSLLLSYGPDVEVIEPKSLRDDISQKAKALYLKYNE